jgi:hypothetical protein
MGWYRIAMLMTDCFKQHVVTCASFDAIMVPEVLQSGRRLLPAGWCFPRDCFLEKRPLPNQARQRADAAKVGYPRCGEKLDGLGVIMARRAPASKIRHATLDSMSGRVVQALLTLIANISAYIDRAAV